ncbi:uncharacterized protein [Medicago truncatula]|uniref:Bet v I/Major latex protein domain-containing protein n=1 Tax=Medicago truncatula TaxID=3880 RepID=G7JLL3_MEDTR|nr:uncharacterized protein LOC11416218 isoform X2 [Medicago truncatula]AFK35399.1 unknown [Medicago truncatula]AFK45419.1 unknown [Medicago truncatula]
MGVTTFTHEYSSTVAPSRMFTALIIDSRNLIPKLLPQFVKDVNIIEGDGGAGSIEQVNFNEGGKRATSCAARSFWMAKSIFVNTTFMDLGDITLLCITLWTICRRSTASDARKPKVSKANCIKSMLIVRTRFLMFDHFA